MNTSSYVAAPVKAMSLAALCDLTHSVACAECSTINPANAVTKEGHGTFTSQCLRNATELRHGNWPSFYCANDFAISARMASNQRWSHHPGTQSVDCV